MKGVMEKEREEFNLPDQNKEFCSDFIKKRVFILSQFFVLFVFLLDCFLHRTHP